MPDSTIISFGIDAEEAVRPMKSAVVQLESGSLAGEWNADHTVCAFKGIPYARPPVGPLRWRPPQPLQRWSGTRPATGFGPRCVQPNRPPRAVGYFGPEPESEDCLYLNLWTASPAPGEKRPVMLWLHGGAFLVGSGSLPIFDGAALARRGAVVVTINYRLGRLGFLAHPQLSAEQPLRVSGNYGLLDQIAALRWVEANIAAFGGDPGQVTIFGQSAGSSSVSSLMASPLAKGLFHRAIGQSGGAFFASILAPLDVAETAGATFARALGAGTIEELRSKSVREVQFRRPTENGILKETYDASDPKGIDRATAWSVMDGYVHPDLVMNVFARGEQNDVALISGANADEGTTQPAISSLAEFQRRARADYGTMADAFLARFPAGNDAETIVASRRVIGTRVFNWENFTWANMQVKTGRSPVYFYHFAHVPPKPAFPGWGGDLGRQLGAFHTAEIPYLFQTLESRDWPWRDVDRELSELMVRYWVNFATSGDPNGAGLPPWPRYAPTQQTTLFFDQGTRVGALPDRATLQFWTDFDARLRSPRAA
jgi:para-nitrobenzyl esterase